MPSSALPAASCAPEIGRFMARLQASLADASFVKLALSQASTAAGGVQRVLARRLHLRGQDALSFTLRHASKDITLNLPLPEALARIEQWLGGEFGHAHLHSRSHDVQLAMTRKGAWQLRSGRLGAAPAEPAPAAAHNRERAYPLTLATPFLAALGIADDQQRLVPAMARKWRQINKFVELLGQAVEDSGLAETARSRPLRVLDFGSGKGYLTFAVHHHLASLGLSARVTGVELRQELTDLGNAAAAQLGLQGIDFEPGDIHQRPAEPVDIMIALHACDTATDVAMHRGVVSGAALVICSPCCHKELRPQMRPPELLAPLLRHGIHMTEQAEMLTDGLRALRLQAQGYDTRVFEFISPEHSAKNKMVLAVRRAEPLAAAQRELLLAQAQALKAAFGITSHSLDRLFAGTAA